MYGNIAKYYDLMMAETDYSAIADRICGYFGERGPVKTVADIGCGTGKLTVELKKRGYDVIGADISEEMLAVAEKNARDAGEKIRFVRQDMRNLELGSEYDAVVCTVDGINHIRTQRGLRECFRSVGRCLRQGGVFIFDVNTPYKFEKIYGNGDFVIEQEGALCAWSCYYIPEEKREDFQLTFFACRDDGLYERSDELRSEYIYTKKEIISALLAAGLSPVKTEGVDAADGSGEDGRWIFVSAKP